MSASHMSCLAITESGGISGMEPAAEPCERCGTDHGVTDHGLGWPLSVWLCDDCACAACEAQAERRAEA